MLRSLVWNIMFHTALLQVLMTSGEQNVPRKLRIVFGCCRETKCSPQTTQSFYKHYPCQGTKSSPPSVGAYYQLGRWYAYQQASNAIAGGEHNVPQGLRCRYICAAGTVEYRGWGTKCSPGTTVSLYLRSRHSRISRVGNKMFPTQNVVLILRQHTQ